MHVSGFFLVENSAVKHLKMPLTEAAAKDMKHMQMQHTCQPRYMIVLGPLSLSSLTVVTGTYPSCSMHMVASDEPVPIVRS